MVIDVADVFLESLNRQSFFLRHPEYYSGVMILTTTRYLSTNPAFESRVDITLGLSELDKATRAQIWRNFLDNDGGNEGLGDNAIVIPATMILSGRQTESAVKTARVLAASAMVPLRIDHI
ncbi:hypothetical protein QQZ08_008189 [Neonectria magnoliae]|uniref:Uncharacterized protein n=1 Tax=Neonectria magnoliae TaxID=2732573 RepID=A0ABR1HVT3_9HYPO